MKRTRLKSNPAQHARRKNRKTVELLTKEHVRTRRARPSNKTSPAARKKARSTNIKAAFACKAASGFWPIKAPLGYKTVHRSSMRAVLMPSKQQASVIGKLFESYAARKASIDDLVKLAAEEGLHRANSTKHLGPREILRTLQNPVYCGIIQWKGFVTCGKHIKLVSIPVWEKVQVRIQVEEKSARRGTRRS